VLSIPITLEAAFVLAALIHPNRSLAALMQLQFILGKANLK
jgi:hypothetical protein